MFFEFTPTTQFVMTYLFMIFFLDKIENVRHAGFCRKGMTGRNVWIGGQS